MAWTSPRTWVAGETVTAALLNAHLRDQLNALGTWTAYTPTWTGSSVNPTLGNGTVTGFYCQVGKTVWFRILTTFGSTTTAGTGVYNWTLPATAAVIRSAGMTGACFDTSATTVRTRVGYLNTTTTVALMDDAGSHVAATVPFTWATGDTISITGFYESA